MDQHITTRTLQTCYLLLTLALLPWSTTAFSADGRQALTASAPTWLRAVGKLQVPGQRFQGGYAEHYVEDCSATLVAQRADERANTIVTAWHCLELYGDLSKPIVFTLRDHNGLALHREAYRLADGGGMHADWAILRLRKMIAPHQVAAMAINPQQADTGRPITMAGYSGDGGLGENGERLTFDPACTIHSQRTTFGDTDCTAHKGASGGAVIQISGGGEAQLCGVISQGNGEGRSTYVPVSGFRGALNLYLKGH